MANLTETWRLRIWRGLMRRWSNAFETITGSSSELLTTVNETDNWIDLAQSNYVQSLTYGDNYDSAQKTLIFCAVACARVGILGMLRALLGTEVD